MQPVLNLLDDSDFLSLGALIGVLCFVGGKMVTPPSRVHAWGLRLAAAAFVAYGIHGYVSLKPDDANTLLSIAFRGLFAAGLVLGISWIVLPILAFVYDNTLGLVMKKLRDFFFTIRRKAAERRSRREEDKRRRQAERVYAQQAPERERARLEAQAQAKRDAEDRRRRADARTDCELMYARLAPDLGDRFTKEMFDDFVKRHLDNDHPADYVEGRAQQLQALLQQHYEKVHPPPKFKNMVEIAAWYEQMQQQIKAQSVDDRAKRAQLAQLNLRYRDLMNDYLENVQP